MRFVKTDGRRKFVPAVKAFPQNIARIAKAASHKLPGKSCPDHDDHHDHHDKGDHYDHHYHHDHGDHDDHGDHEEVGSYMRTRKLKVIWKANQP